MIYSPKSQNTQLRLTVRCEELNRIYFKDSLNAVLVIKTQMLAEKPRIVFTSKPVKNCFNPEFPEEIRLVHSFEGTFLPNIDNQRYIFQVYSQGHEDHPIG